VQLRREILDVAESPMVVIATIAESKPGSIKLCYGESDLPTPPFIVDALNTAARAGHTFYTHTAGCHELRQAIADKVHELHGVRYEPSEIMATTGATMAIYASIRALIGAGDNAVIVSPSYAIYDNATIMCGGEPRQVPLSLSDYRFILDLDRIRERIDRNTRMLIVNSPSNPTGWVISEDEQRALIEIAEAHGLVILADEVYERFVYIEPEERWPLEPPAPSFARLHPNRDRLIVTNSFSKTYNMTGWRLGWAQTGASTIKALYKAVEFMTSNPAAMVQQAGITALRDGERHIAELRTFYQGRRNQVMEGLARLPGVTLPDPRGAFFAFPKFEGMRDSSAFATKLVRETGLAIAPGVGFGRDGEGFVRICFASSEATIAEALLRLEIFLARSH
jgi:aspartate/methionine/tyrosine aminotransferase